MALDISKFVPRSVAARSRLMTMIIVAVAAICLLAGIGERITKAYEDLTDAERIAALSLVMSGVPEEALPLTLLEVDDATRLDWGDRRVTPHAALAKLIAMSASHGASAVMVDFDLSGDAPEQKADQIFLQLLAEYPPEAPPLLLARTILFVRGEGGGAGDVQASGSAATPYDAVVSGKPNIQWVTTLNDISSDRSVKKIRLWQTVCTGSAGTAYPSPALAVAAWLFPGSDHRAELAGFLDSRVQSECGKTAETEHAWPPVEEQAATIPYVFADATRMPASFRIDHGGKRTVALRRIRAGQLVKVDNGQAAAAGEIDRDPFENRVVLIGATHAGSGDFYETPFGTMSGVMIVANSITQAKTIVETTPAAAWIKNVLVLALFLIFAVVARKLQGAPAVIVIAILSIAALFIISRMFGFATGTNIIAIAVPGFALFKLVDSIGHIALHWPSLGWRALLKK